MATGIMIMGQFGSGRTSFGKIVSPDLKEQKEWLNSMSCIKHYLNG